ncbi:hypothetical protein B0H14DRAFT_3487814 [Mycena olivaceomarginata]|nr:hypothetical protein B0H14DRAFT_3487814 [Mycena olivaceomarginata]
MSEGNPHPSTSTSSTPAQTATQLLAVADVSASGRTSALLSSDMAMSANVPDGTSAQVIRAASHRAHYVNRTSGLEYERPRRSIPYLPPLPHEIHRLQQKRLPESAVLYQDALGGDDIVLSNEGLPRWMAKPPFAMDEDETDPYSADYRFWTECLEAIIHGYRMRLQLEDDRQRRLDLTAKGWSVFMDALREEVFELLRNWEMVNIRMYHAYHASRQYRMHKLYLWWQARTIYHLYYLRFLE